MVVMIIISIISFLISFLNLLQDLEIMPSRTNHNKPREFEGQPPQCEARYTVVGIITVVHHHRYHHRRQHQEC